MSNVTHQGSNREGGDMARGYDPTGMKELPPCPVCRSEGSLRPIRRGSRMRGGMGLIPSLFSYVVMFNKSYECTRCRAKFSQNDVLAANDRSHTPAS